MSINGLWFNQGYLDGHENEAQGNLLRVISESYTRRLGYNMARPALPHSTSTSWYEYLHGYLTALNIEFTQTETEANADDR